MKVRDIVIVGGGSSGWTAAAAISRCLPEVRVTLVESPEIGNIGVGESTIPTVRSFHETYLGLTDGDWMPRCDAVFKAAIRFEDFCEKGGETIYHPFGDPALQPELEGIGYGDWHRRKQRRPELPILDFYASFFPNAQLCERNRFDLSVAGSGYAYHFDADRYASYLKPRCLAAGVTYRQATIQGVERTEHGCIETLVTSEGERIGGNLFLDCSGFSAILIDKALEEPFIDLNGYLLNDKCIAARLPYRDKEAELKPYTNCQALSAGWAWTIPLWSRVGVGYVYSSAFQSPEEAERELRAHLGPERVRDSELRHIDIRVGRHERVWVKNCVSLVLSAGFIEPLESTGIALTQFGIAYLIDVLRGHEGYASAVDRAFYNRMMTGVIDEVWRFVFLHYALTRREDTPYWKAVKDRVPVPDAVTDIVAAVRQRGDLGFVRDMTIFHETSWQSILLGYQLPGAELRPDGARAAPRRPDAIQRLARFHDQTAARVRELPSHYAYLRETIYDGAE